MIIKLPNNKNTTVYINDASLAPVFAASITPPFVYVALNPNHTEHAREILENCGLVLGQDAHVASQQELETKVPRLPNPLKISAGEKIGMKKLGEKIAHFGYARTAKVENHNEYSIRGDIIDIWQNHHPHPTRIMMFGDMVEAIKAIDAGNFSTIDTLKVLEIAPIPDKCHVDEWQTVFDTLLAKTKTFITEKHDRIEIWTDAPTPFKSDQTLTIKTAPVANYFSALSILIPEITWNVHTRGKTVFVFVGSSRACERYMETKGISYVIATPDNFTPHAINIIRQSLGVSFELVDKDIVIYSVGKTHHAAGGVGEVASPTKEIFPTDNDFILPEIGAFVVHQHHGLGRYLGIKQMDLAGTVRDYIVLQYDGGAFVYLPPDRTHELYNYFGSPRRLDRI